MIVQWVFYLFSISLLLSALMVICVRNPVHAALFLVLCFFSMAVIWLLLLAEFLAIVLVLVYVGAVMVLFLFVVMMLDINVALLREGFASYLPIGIGVALALVLVMGLALYQGMPGAAGGGALAQPETVSNTVALGKALFTMYLYEFEIAGAVLLVAIIAAIALSLTTGKRNKSMDPAVQVRADRKGRLRMVDMRSESEDRQQ